MTPDRLVTPDAPSARSLRVESDAIYVALSVGLAGAITGLAIGLSAPPLPLAGPDSFGRIAAAIAGVVAVVAATVGYWRVRQLPGQEWRRDLASWVFIVNTIGVVLVHAALAALAVVVAFLVLGLGFIGLNIEPFWATVLMSVVLGLTAYVVYLSVSKMSTQRMSALLMAFVMTGTLTAMVTTPDPAWWETHFSHLGTFGDLSSFIFNGTLVVGGLLVTAFAVYLSHDMGQIVETGALERADSPKIVSTMFVVMGVMLAGVGLVPVNVSMLVHNLCASGMGVMYMGLLIWGPRLLRGMPRAYFISAWAFLGSLVVSIVLFAGGYFGLTALEIVVFALIFGWIAVFIRFLGVAGGPHRRGLDSPHRHRMTRA